MDKKDPYQQLAEVLSKEIPKSEKKSTMAQLQEARQPMQEKNPHKKHFWVEENPGGTWAIVEAFPGGTVRSPFRTKDEAINRERDIAAYAEWDIDQVPSPQEKFPKQLEALQQLYPYEFVEYHDDGDLTIQQLIPKKRPDVGFTLGDLIVVTTDGKTFKQAK